MRHYLQNMIDNGIVTVETDPVTGKELVRMTPDTFQRMLSSDVTTETKNKNYVFHDNSRNIIRKKDIDGEDW